MSGTGPVRITLDRGLCVGSGQCVLTAPDLFDQTDDGLGSPRDPNPPPERHGAARTAAHVCPARAITVDPA